jgi:hypothetical protein
VIDGTSTNFERAVATVGNQRLRSKRGSEQRAMRSPCSTIRPEVPVKQTTRAVVLVVAIAAGAGAAFAIPHYIEASPEELTAAFGADVAKHAFSDELTETRTSLITPTIPPDAGCGEDPKMKLTNVVPYGTGGAMWIERFNVECKEPLTRTLLVLMKDNKPRAMPLLPGTTVADPSLQVDASNIVTTAALTRAKKNCEDAGISDTEVTKAPPEGGGPWTERWTVITCNEPQEIDVNFTPSAQGGTDISVVASQ